MILDANNPGSCVVCPEGHVTNEEHTECTACAEGTVPMMPYGYLCSGKLFKRRIIWNFSRIFCNPPGMFLNLQKYIYGTDRIQCPIDSTRLRGELARTQTVNI